MVVTELAIALLAAAAIFLDAPFLLDWHNASAVFSDPIKAHIGVVLLTHQLGYFNILPLYVVLIFIGPKIFEFGGTNILCSLPSLARQRSNPVRANRTRAHAARGNFGVAVE